MTAPEPLPLDSDAWNDLIDLVMENERCDRRNARHRAEGALIRFAQPAEDHRLIQERPERVLEWARKYYAARKAGHNPDESRRAAFDELTERYDSR